MKNTIKGITWIQIINWFCRIFFFRINRLGNASKETGIFIYEGIGIRFPVSPIDKLALKVTNTDVKCYWLYKFKTPKYIRLD